MACARYSVFKEPFGLFSVQITSITFYLLLVKSFFIFSLKIYRNFWILLYLFLKIYRNFLDSSRGPAHSLHFLIV